MSEIESCKEAPMKRRSNGCDRMRGNRKEKEAVLIFRVSEEADESPYPGKQQEASRTKQNPINRGREREEMKDSFPVSSSSLSLSLSLCL